MFFYCYSIKSPLWQEVTSGTYRATPLPDAHQVREDTKKKQHYETIAHFKRCRRANRLKNEAAHSAERLQRAPA